MGLELADKVVPGGGMQLLLTERGMKAGAAVMPSNQTQADTAPVGVALASTAVTMGIGSGIGALEGAAAGTSESLLPSMVARVIPADINATTLAAPGAADAFVTDSSAIQGMNASQLSQGLTIPESPSGFQVIEFPTPEGIASPINRLNPGFVGGGQTAGGLPEYVVPNGPIPANATTRIVPPTEE